MRADVRADVRGARKRGGLLSAGRYSTAPARNKPTHLVKLACGSLFPLRVPEAKVGRRQKPSVKLHPRGTLSTHVAQFCVSDWKKQRLAEDACKITDVARQPCNPQQPQQLFNPRTKPRKQPPLQKAKRTGCLHLDQKLLAPKSLHRRRRRKRRNFADQRHQGVEVGLQRRQKRARHFDQSVVGGGVGWRRVVSYRLLFIHTRGNHKPSSSITPPPHRKIDPKKIKPNQTKPLPQKKPQSSRLVPLPQLC